MKEQDIEVQKIARSQHGNISWPQLQRLRVSRGQVKRRVRSGEWVRELPGVWRLGWAEESWMQRAWCAALWRGSEALISHRAAARLWGLDCIKSEAIELSAPRPVRSRARWLLTHRTGPLLKPIRRMRNGLPLTSPPRTLVDLAGVVDEDTLQRALEEAIRRRIVSEGELRRVLRWVPRLGRTGTARLTRLLDGGVLQPDMQSELERRALALFRRFGLPEPHWHYVIIEGDMRLGEVDFAWSDAKVVVEADSFEFHSGRRKWESDIARYNAMVLHGWTVLRLTWADVGERAEDFASGLSRALANGRRRRGRCGSLN